MFTFAIVGCDEGTRLGTAVRQAQEASRPGDVIWFVDSGSTDGSAQVAASLGARVLRAPRGKGLAIDLVLGEAVTDRVVLLDADIDRTTSNFAASLRTAIESSGADLVVAEFQEPRRKLRHTSRYIWRPLVEALFPEVHDRFGPTPLSGFRALRTGWDLGQIPGGFGAEAHLNLVVATAGGAVEVADVGTYWGPIRPKPLLGLEVGAAILDLAEARGRLDAQLRPRWDEWVRRVVEVVVEGPTAATDGDAPRDTLYNPDYVERLERAASRPRPSATGRARA